MSKFDMNVAIPLCWHSWLPFWIRIFMWTVMMGGSYSLKWVGSSWWHLVIKGSGYIDSNALFQDLFMHKHQFFVFWFIYFGYHDETLSHISRLRKQWGMHYIEYRQQKLQIPNINSQVNTKFMNLEYILCFFITTRFKWINM